LGKHKRKQTTAMSKLGKFERSEHIGALSEELFDSSADDHAKEAMLSIFGFYSAYYLKGPNDDYHREHWRQQKDVLNEYSWNSFGYRDKEFVGPVEIIAAGCSMTMGQGVPVEARWSNQLAKKLNMTVATTAVAGWSTQTAINAVMHYILTFGKPKIVALLLPDFFRYDLLLNTAVFQPKWITDNKETNITRRTVEVSGSARDLSKFSKRPHDSSEVIPSEFSYFSNGQALRFFIEYCKEAKISLIWGTWDMSTHEAIDHASKVKVMKEMSIQAPKIDFSGYIDIKYFHNYGGHVDPSAKLKELNCHSNLKQKYEKYFDLGTDTDYHMGVHLHAHVADKFYEKLKLNNYEK
jgi:hypothetical protein